MRIAYIDYVTQENEIAHLQISEQGYAYYYKIYKT